MQNLFARARIASGVRGTMCHSRISLRPQRLYSNAFRTRSVHPFKLLEQKSPLPRICPRFLTVSTHPDEMKYLNTIENEKHVLPVAAYHINTPPEEYDLNCEIPIKVLESNGVRLEPFIPSLHAKLAFELLQHENNIELYRWLPYGPFGTLPEFLTWLESRIRSDRHSCLFLISDLSRPQDEKNPYSRIAGWIGILNISAADLVGEIGHVTVLKEAWKTHVNTHASSLLIKYLLSPQPDGLGFRRASWLAHKNNEPSNAAALRLGFTHEGTIRYAKLLKPEKEGGIVESDQGLGSPEKGKYRDTQVWSITWEDWEKNGVDEKIDGLLKREVKKHEPMAKLLGYTA